MMAAEPMSTDEYTEFRNMGSPSYQVLLSVLCEHPSGIEATPSVIVEFGTEENWELHDGTAYDEIAHLIMDWLGENEPGYEMEGTVEAERQMYGSEPDIVAPKYGRNAC